MYELVFQKLQKIILFYRVQSVERMRRLRRKFFPQTPRNMANLHDLLTAADNEHFAMTLQNPHNRLKYINLSHLLSIKHTKSI